jgi:outer membrane protein assembly factor BamD (BamD/ComL family)
MSLTQEQKNQINNLIDHRDQIVDALFHIERILKQYFPEESNIAYQYYIPQITTALYEDKKWLTRGEHTMQQTINRLLEKSKNSDDKSVYRHI